MATEYERGQVIRITATLKDANDTLVDPDQDGGEYLFTIEIKNVTTGTAVVPSTTMSRSGTGTFYYDWQSSESDDVGQYEIESRATYNGKEILNRDYVDLVLVT